MVFRKLDVFGNPYVGVYAKASDGLVLLARSIPEEVRKLISSALDVEAVELTLGGATIIGPLSALNSNGLVTVDFAYSQELAPVERTLKVARLADKFNAAGNNILANDRAALVNPDLSDASIRLIHDTLGLSKVARGTVAGLKTVGAAAVATNKGVLCHPYTTQQELAVLKVLFQTRVAIGTVNFGSPLIGAGLAANSKGVVVGSASTGIEIGRVQAALGFLD